MKYDYIIAGGGCAGLSLLLRILQSDQLRSKRILLVDQEIKSANDRTWCFWEEQPGYFDHLVHRKWKQLDFHTDDYSAALDIGAYEYKMIRSRDFYRYCFDLIRTSLNVEVLQAQIDSISTEEEHASAIIDGREYTCDYLFNSILFQKPEAGQKYHFLKQHFQGWFIKTNQKVFDKERATLMDFRVNQRHGTTFTYTLPLSENEALVEYTLFTKDLLSHDEYESSLREYIANILQAVSYEITEQEFGVIPMTNYPFSPGEGRIINIGTAGGQTKASTGYTFNFIQKHVNLLSEEMIHSGRPGGKIVGSRRFNFYDSVLLNVLANKKLEGKTIFTDLFKKGDAQKVLKFLDNETSLLEEFDILGRLPSGVFTRSAWEELF